MSLSELTYPKQLTALLCILLLLPVTPSLPAQDAQPAQAAPAEAPPKLLPPEQLDSLVAPIALYPDPLLAQILAASTYPLEIVEAGRWLKENASLKGEALTDAAQKQEWDPSVQALVAFPDALKRMDGDIKWTTQLGNAFLDQQEAVMDAVQRMRALAQEKGTLQTTKEQKVEKTVVENKTIVEIQPADPQVVYVPQYNPVVVYGPPVYPYPPIYYPPPPPPGAVVAAVAISFGIGIMMGAYWGGCCRGFGWGWGCHWRGGGNTIIINNHFHNRYRYRSTYGGDRIGNGNRWTHNRSHRGPVPYSNRAAAQKYGGMTRDNKGNIQRYDRPGGSPVNRPAARPATPSTRPAARPAAPSTRPATRDISPSTRDRSRDSAMGGMEPRNRAQASSDRGFSSARPSTRPSARPAPSPRPQSRPATRPQSRPAPRGGR